MRNPQLKSKRVRHRCVLCNKHFSHGFNQLCDACGGLVEVEYDLSTVEIRNAQSTVERFFDVLPIQDPAHLLPSAFPPTPCLHARSLGRAIGLNSLYLKNESVLPTGSTKDRMALITLSYLKDCGIREFCASSTGNSSTAFALAAQGDPGWHIRIFTGERFVSRVSYIDRAVVEHFVLRGATFVEAAAFSREYAHRHRLEVDRGFFNPARREGLKLAFFEASEQIDRPIDRYVQAVSSGMGVYGVYKGAKELLALGKIERLPKLLCVQQTSCDPMARAYNDGSDCIRPEHIVKDPKGIALAILRGDPTRAYPYLRSSVSESGGTICSVDESEIRSARRLLANHEGIVCCYSASTALAGLVKLARNGQVAPSECVLVNLTGRDRSASAEASHAQWLRKAKDNDWVPLEGGARVGIAERANLPEAK